MFKISFLSLFCSAYHTIILQYFFRFFPFSFCSSYPVLPPRFLFLSVPFLKDYIINLQRSVNLLLGMPGGFSYWNLHFVLVFCFRLCYFLDFFFLLFDSFVMRNPADKVIFFYFIFSLLSFELRSIQFFFQWLDSKQIEKIYVHVLCCLNLSNHLQKSFYWYYMTENLLIHSYRR